MRVSDPATNTYFLHTSQIILKLSPINIFPNLKVYRTIHIQLYIGTNFVPVWLLYISIFMLFTTFNLIQFLENGKYNDD